MALSSPLLVGVYEDEKLIKLYESNDPASEALPKIFKEILDKFKISELFYANGPGSFMAIKVSFVFLRSMQITLGIPLNACNGFEFNSKSPIKAIGNQWFFKENNDIVLRQRDDINVKPFRLPCVLNKAIFSKNSEPLYILPAV